jgi:hypothetical protein
MNGQNGQGPVSCVGNIVGGRAPRDHRRHHGVPHAGPARGRHQDLRLRRGRDGQLLHRQARRRVGRPDGERRGRDGHPQRAARRLLRHRRRPRRRPGGRPEPGRTRSTASPRWSSSRRVRAPSSTARQARAAASSTSRSASTAARPTSTTSTATASPRSAPPSARRYVMLDLQDPSARLPRVAERLQRRADGPAGQHAARPRRRVHAWTATARTAPSATRSRGSACASTTRGSRVTEDDSSRVTSSSVFDFNGDGAAEVVYNDECFFRVYDGLTSEVLFKNNSPSRTRIENPVIADVDNDGNAEIVFCSNNDASACSAGATSRTASRCGATPATPG